MLGSNSSDIEKVAPLIEEHVRNEIGASEPLPYEIEWPGEEGQGSAYWRSVNGGKAVIYCYFHFNLPGSPPTLLRITMQKDAFSGCSAAMLHYETEFSKTIGDIVALPTPRPLGLHRIWKVRFDSTDDATREKLNANAELITLANRFYRTRKDDLQIEGVFALLPEKTGTLFMVKTLPKSVYEKDALQIKDFLAIATMIEETL